MDETSDDFNLMAEKMISDLNDKNRIRDIVNQCKLFINSIIRTNSLPNPHKNFTIPFLINTLPEVINVIMKSQMLPHENVREYIDFFKKATLVIPIAFEHDELRVCTKLTKIFNQRNSFFQKNNGFNSKKEAKNKRPRTYDALIYNFTNKQGLTIMALRLIRAKNLTIQHFSVFFELFDVLNEVLPNEYGENIAKLAYESFNVFLQTNEEITTKKFDMQTFDNSINHAFKLVEHYPKQGQEIVYGILEISKKCLLADIFDKQMYGVSFLAKIAESNVATVKNAFRRFFETPEFLTSILSHDPHPEILNRMVPIFRSMENVSYDKLMLLWNTAQKYHHSQRSALLPIIEHILLKFDDETITGFVIENATKNLQQDTIKMLFSIANKLAANRKELSSNLFLMIMNLSNDYVLTAYKDVLSELTAQAMSVLIDISKQQMKEKRTTFVPFIEPIVSKVSSPRNSFDAKYIEQLLDMLFNAEEGEKIMPLFAEITITTNTHIKPEIVESLFFSPNMSAVWSFFSGLIKKIGTTTFSNECVECFENFFNNEMNPVTQVSNEFMEFIRLFIISVNTREDKIVSDDGRKKQKNKIPEKYFIRSIPLTGDSILFRIMKDGTEQFAERAVRVLTEIYRNTGEAQYPNLASMIKAQFTRYRETKYSSYVASFAKNVCHEIEQNRLIDYGYISHEMAYENGDDYIMIKFTNNKRDYSILFPREGNCQDLYHKIEKKLSNPKDMKISINGETIPKNGIISKTKLCEGGSVFISCRKSNGGPERILPTIHLFNLRFPSMLTDAIRHSNKKEQLELLYKALISMPTVNNIVKGMENMNSFIEEIKAIIKKGASSPGYVILFRYYIQALTIHGKDFIPSFIKENGLDVLFGLFKGKNNLLLNSTKEISKILQLIPPEELKGKEDLLIPILLGIYNREGFAKKSKPVLAKLLAELSEANPKVAEKAAFSNIEGTVSAVQDVSNECWTYIKRFIKAIPNKNRVLVFSEEQIEKGKTRFIEIYADYAIDESRESADIEIDRCLDYINDKLPTTTVMSLLSVIATKIEEAEEEDEFCDRLLNFALRSKNNLINEKIFSIVGCKDRKPLRKFFARLCNTKTERFNYIPEENVRPPLGYVGLRNLGATCYVNSVLQQLFHTNPFISKFLSATFDDEANKLLQDLFAKMAASSQSRCDPEPFLNVWKGWGNAPIVHFEQQDALEFLQLILDKMNNKASDEFKGEFVNTIDDEVEIISETRESFFSVCLTVKDFHNIDESIDSFIQEEHFEYNVEGRGLIDVSKRVRINKAPNILVIQLKRFEYDFNTFDRVKIQDRFEFPDRINIKKLLREPKDKFYNIHGVVLHSGIAQAGHYQSLVKKNNEWIMFNDSEVTLCYDFEGTTFGGKGNINAYLLVYVADTKEADADTVKFINKDTLNAIEKENAMFTDLSCAFSESALKFALQAMNADELIYYFFTVFCHSNRVKYTEEIISKIMYQLEDPRTCQKIAVSLTEKFDIVSDVLINCSDQKMINGIIEIISTILYRINSDNAISFGKKFVDLLKELEPTYKQIPYVSKIILRIVKQHPYECINENWENSILEFVIASSEDTTKTMFSQNVDMSYLFEALSIFALNKCDTSSFHLMIEKAIRILLSKKQSQAFLKMAAELSTINVVPLDTVLGLMMQDETMPNADQVETLIAIITGLNDENSVSDVIEMGTKKLTVKAFVDSFIRRIRNGDSSLRKSIIEYPKPLLINFITSNDKEVSGNAENLVVSLFPGAPRLDEMPKEKVYPEPKQLPEESENFPTDVQQRELEDLLNVFMEMSEVISECGPEDVNIEAFARVTRFIITPLEKKKSIVHGFSHFFDKAKSCGGNIAKEVLMTVAMFDGDESISILIDNIEAQFEQKSRDLKTIRKHLTDLLPIIKNMKRENLTKVFGNKVWISVFETLSTVSGKDDIEMVATLCTIISRINDKHLKMSLIKSIYFGDDQCTTKIDHFYKTFTYLGDDFTQYINVRMFTRLNETLKELSKLTPNDKDFEAKSAAHERICNIFKSLDERKADFSKIVVKYLLQYGTRTGNHHSIIAMIVELSQKNEYFLNEAQKAAKEFQRTLINKNSGTAWFVAILRCKLCAIKGVYNFAEILSDSEEQHKKVITQTSVSELYEYWIEDDECTEGCVEAVPLLIKRADLEKKYEKDFFKKYLPFVEDDKLRELLTKLCESYKINEKNGIQTAYIKGMKKAYYIAKDHPNLRKEVRRFKPDSSRMALIEKDNKLMKYISTIFN